MDISNVIALLGGIALFLFGMSLMGDGLKRVAGNRLELILYRLSSTPLKGILLGTGVTAVIQSSSATSVMVVGFVNSGMMRVRQAIGVVLGAILGTSITGWILCLNSLGGSGASVTKYLNTTMLTGIVALGGIALWMFAKKTTSKNIGGIMLGCVRGVGLLMPEENWISLGVMTLAGIAVYGGLCLAWWRISGKGIRIGRRS